MRVAFVTASPQVWGAEESLLLLLEFLDHFDDVETITVVDTDSPFANRLAAGRHCYERHQFAKHSALSKGSASAATPLQLAREIPAIAAFARRIKSLVSQVDIVVVFSVWQAFEVMLAAKMARKPVVIDLHETFGGRRAKKILPLIARMANLTIAPSRAVLNSGGIQIGKRTAVIARPVCINAQLRQESVGDFPNKDRLTIGMFGQIAPHKGVKDLLGAVSSCEPAVRGMVSVLIVGGNPDPSRRTAYGDEVRKIAMAEDVASISVINRVEDISNLMQRCDLVTNLSNHEAFGRTVVEAISCGAFPIVLNNGGPAEIVNDTGIGRIISAAECLQEIVGEFVLMKRDTCTLNRASRVELIESHYAPERITLLYRNALNQVLASRAGRKQVERTSSADLPELKG